MGVTTRGHQLWHPMQEYCARGTRKQATRAWLKLIANNLTLRRGRLRGLAPYSRRYLPHDPAMAAAPSSARPTSSSSSTLPSSPSYRKDLGSGPDCSNPAETTSTASALKADEGPHLVEAEEQEEAVLGRGRRPKSKGSTAPLTSLVALHSINHVPADDEGNTGHLQGHSSSTGMRPSKPCHRRDVDAFRNIVRLLEDQNGRLIDQLRTSAGVPRQAKDQCREMQEQLRRLNDLVAQVFGEAPPIHPNASAEVPARSAVVVGKIGRL